ncbi:MAG TPA: hypothetical protein VFT74_20270 [Isosphaeraceae bacterium]|nr:hypothetical protein [Isosphaeraceae bacterium]
MTDHTCKEVTEGCYRCDLGKDEVIGGWESLIEDITNRLWKTSIDKLYIIEAVLDLE